MGWMKEVAMIIEEAAEHDIELTLADFRREGDFLTLDGMPADQWLEAMTGQLPDRLEDLEI